MDTETMIRELERVEENHKDDRVFTGQLNIAEMAHDVRLRLEELKPYEDTSLTPEQIQLLKERDTAGDNDGWIPVEERLPDNNENVLVTTDMGLIASGYIAHGTWITDQEPDYPIAWRPLPEPYRQERRGGE